jgi:DNA-binding transcriptional ArsR family regulator
MPARDDALALLATAADASADIRRLWDHPALGLSLVAKFYSDDPWVSAAELAEATDLSEDTIRRKLDTLERIGRVRRGKRGRVAVYKAHRNWAARTHDIVKSMVLAANCG